jgi:hypothetical protein
MGHFTYTTEYIIYDDGCHLKKYAMNPRRCDKTETAKLISSISIAVDKMHMRGHVDPWCKKTCDPKLFSDLNQVSHMIFCMEQSNYIYHGNCLPNH